MSAFLLPSLGRTPVRCLLLFLALQLLMPTFASAALIIRQERRVEDRPGPTETRPKQVGLKQSRLHERLLNVAGFFQRAPRYEAVDDDPIFGIISFVAGLIGLACIVLIAANVSPGIFVVVGSVAAVLAIICGAKGLKRRKSGLAVIGMTLGILEVVAGLIIVVASIAALLDWLK